MLLVCAVAITRVFFRSHFLYDVDSVNFALALRRFDPAAHQPHPPGYFLYVCLGRLVNGLLPNPNTALVAVSIAASCAAAWMIYLLTKEWFDRGPALIALGLFLVSPLCWFHGTVALTYIVEAFFSALIGYLCWQAYNGRVLFTVPASLAFGIAAGFRPSTALLLAPLWLVSIYRVRGAYRALGVFTAGAAVLAWFIPMTVASGGAARYFGALAHLWATVPGKRTVLSSPALAIARLVTVGWIFVLCFGAATPFLFRQADRAPLKGADPKRFTWIWVLPGLLFFTFVFLNYVNSGYLLVLCPPAFAWVAARIHGFLRSQPHSVLRRAALAAGVAANCAVFAFAPLYCTSRGVRDFERNLSTVTKDFREHLNPADTLIIGFDSHFLGYRHAGYYLPDFVIVQYPEVAYPDGKRVFWMHGRNTRVVSAFSADGFARFALFPLPEGDQYAEYLKGVQGKLPGGALVTALIGNKRVLTGPASAIPLLFPSTACFDAVTRRCETQGSARLPSPRP